jgi:hypothetical protein
MHTPPKFYRREELPAHLEAAAAEVESLCQALLSIVDEEKPSAGVALHALLSAMVLVCLCVSKDPSATAKDLAAGLVYAVEMGDEGAVLQ